jgi:hypothetical protein
MRHAWLISILLALPSTLLADDMTNTNETVTPPPPYQPLRYNESYAYLTNAANRIDWLDRIKYIPLRADEPLCYLTLGGELRERFEGNYDPNFGIGVPGPNSYLLQRITMLADLHLGPRVRFFAEGVSGLEEGNSQPAPPTQQDPIDLQFAFLDVVPYLTDDESLTVRVGRFGLSFGSGRLVDTRPPVNVDFRYDGAELLYSRPLWNATAFLTQPVMDSGGLNGENHSTTFWGLYVTHWLDAPHARGLDLYYLGIYNKEATFASGTAPERRQTFGTRQFGTWKQWDLDTEEVLQTGTFGNNPILAWTASMCSGYTVNTTWQPRLGLKVDVASGSSHADGGQLGTFNALFFKSGYFNDANLIRPQNLIDVHPNLTLKLARNVSLDGGGDVFWRYSKDDAVYALPVSTIAIPALENASRYVGTAADVNLTWQLQRHLLLQASYVHFFVGSYVRQAGGSNLNYVSTTISFLF